MIEITGGARTLRALVLATALLTLATARAEAAPFLTEVDVRFIAIIAAATSSLDSMIVAVTDREGVPLAVFRKQRAPIVVPGNFGLLEDANDVAVGLARTGAFFSNDQAPLSSRTVRFISGIHFPPGVRNRPPAALYGIENTNRGCALNTTFNAGKDVRPATSVNGLPCDSTDQRGCGTGIVTGKSSLDDAVPTVNGGGVPIFKDGQVVGGIGVTGVPADIAETAALVGSVFGLTNDRFGPRPAAPGVIFLDGIRLPFVVVNIPRALQPLQNLGRFVLQPRASRRGAAGVPEGWLVGPRTSATITAAQVRGIVNNAVAQANRTRAAIRLPLGSATRMVIAVTDLSGELLGLFRMPDATVFSIDVAVAKARNVVYFSSTTRDPDDLPGVPPGTAVTNRTIGFGAQPLFPPGIDETAPGPFFPLFVDDVANPCSQGSEPPNPNQSGIVFFPGSMPLYRNGGLVGGLGVSGDGVEQDDLVAAAGATPGLAPPLAIRADRVFVQDLRLPFLKFPRNPEVR